MLHTYGILNTSPMQGYDHFMRQLSTVVREEIIFSPGSRRNLVRRLVCTKLPTTVIVF